MVITRFPYQQTIFVDMGFLWLQQDWHINKNFVS